MHELGYNFFNMGALTYSETHALIDAWNRRESKKKKNINKSKSKPKRR